MRGGIDVAMISDNTPQSIAAQAPGLFECVYDELHRLARRERQTHGKDATLNTTALVHETYLKLREHVDELTGKAQFFALAARAMRQILVDYARRRLRQKRGSAAVHIPIDAAVILAPEQIEQTVAVDLALQRLAKADERKSRVFEMRFFGGLTVEEVAEVLSVAPNTVIRDWNFARAWVKRELGNPGTIDRGTLATD